MPSEAYGFDDNKLRVAIGDAIQEALKDMNVDATITSRLQRLYPVGSIYVSLSSTNPSTLFGFGTWQRFAQGSVLVGVNENDPDFGSPNKAGGSKATERHTHKLVSKFWLRNSITSSNHILEDVWGSGNNFSYENKSYDTSYYGEVKSSSGYSKKATYITLGGDASYYGNGNAGNLQPYITAYMWQRTA